MVNRRSRTHPEGAPAQAPTSGEGSGGDGAGGVRSVQRALEILDLLSEERPQITIREIVDGTGLAKTTAIRLAQTLDAGGAALGDRVGLHGRARACGAGRTWRATPGSCPRSCAR